jgi:hypothetical protein
MVALRLPVPDRQAWPWEEPPQPDQRQGSSERTELHHAACGSVGLLVLERDRYAPTLSSKTLKRRQSCWGRIFVLPC